MKRICLAVLLVGLLSLPSYSVAEISEPTGVTATEGTYSDTIIVTWNEVPGVYGYEVWRDSYEWCQGAIPCEPEFILYDEIFLHNGIWDRRDILPFGQVFEYRIKACVDDAITNEWICSDFSLPAYGHVLEDAPILPGPTGVTATEGTYSNAITISWDPVPGANGYEIWAINSSEYDCGEQPEPCDPKDFMITNSDLIGYNYGFWVNLSFDVIYEFKIKAYGEDSTSDISLSAYGYVSEGAPLFDWGLPTDAAFIGTGGGCFIATAAYGSYWEPHVMTLRQFRDSYLLKNKLGTIFVETYYRYSPAMAGYIAEHDNLRSIARIWLAPLVGFSLLAINFGIVTALTILFSLLTMVIGGTYFFVRTKESK